MKKFLGNEKDKDRSKERWTHWINRLVQFKVFSTFIDIIPVDQPRLSIALYTKCLVFLLRKLDFIKVQELIQRLPTHMVNHDVLISRMKQLVEDQPVIKDQPDVLEIFYQLYMMDRQYEHAFQTIVSKKDIQVFEFLKKRQLDFSLNEFLVKLIKIDCKQTVEYII